MSTNRIIFVLLALYSCSLASASFAFRSNVYLSVWNKSITTMFEVKEIVIFGAIVIGATLAFLMFNMHPAKVFMGDTGSLFLGGVISGIALYLKMPLILLIIAIIPVIETISVIIQVAFFKKTGKRVFKMAPIHHHFELSGWKENKVVVVFSLITLVASIIALQII